MRRSPLYGGDARNACFLSPSVWSLTRGASYAGVVVELWSALLVLPTGKRQLPGAALLGCVEGSAHMVQCLFHQRGGGSTRRRMPLKGNLSRFHDGSI